MRIAKAVIENFRHIKELSLDFTDSIGRIRDVTLIVGPNTSGKTTILDALAASIGASTELPHTRDGYKLSPQTIVRRGTLEATVTCWVRFTEEEIHLAEELNGLTHDTSPVPDEREIKTTWTYPDPKGKPSGHTSYFPQSGQILFKNRKRVTKLLKAGMVDAARLKNAGGVFSFSQQRPGRNWRIPQEIRDLIPGAQENGRATDPRIILLSLAMLSQLQPSPGVKESKDDNFKLIQELYAQVCAPHKLIGAVRDATGSPDLLFNDGSYDYSYDGLSSGEQMLLLFLIRMATERIHQSLILVDEIELHQHPIWQSKLLYALPKMGINNQIIATTHSPYLRDLLSGEAVINLGELMEPDAAARR